MGSIEIPDQLINALTKLGLVESEAKIYTAIVQMRTAEVKDLLDNIDVSKPRIYDGLGSLQEQGLITMTCPRPVTYLAVEPQIALQMLMKAHEDAKSEAMDQFRLLKSNTVPKRTEEPLWSIYGSKSFEFKIMDMLKNARKSVYCQMSGKYLDYFEKAVKRNVSMHIFLTAEKPELADRLDALSKKGNVHIEIAGNDSMGAMASGPGLDIAQNPMKEHALARLSPDMQAELTEVSEPDNLLILVVDDAEVLFVPPLKSDTIMATWTTNRGMIILMKYLH
jgi:HTH-type transcriptional regulator, sugar sensing transcriptional regulator